MMSLPRLLDSSRLWRPPEETWKGQPLGTVQTLPQTQPGAQVLGVGLTLAGVLGADASAGLFN